MKAFLTIFLLLISNVFMTLAWYGHLKFHDWKWYTKWGVASVILVSWGIALFEYIFQVPANKIGFEENGGPFNMWQLKVIQEVLSLSVFAFFMIFVFKMDTLKWNHLIGFALLVLAVYFIFKK